MKKLKLIIILILVLIIVILISIFLINRSEVNEKTINNISLHEEMNSQENIYKVTNPNIYFTVRSCIEKYISYLYQGDKEALIKIVDNAFIKQFNITENNILNYVEKINGPVTLYIEDMYVRETDANNYEYYIQGNIEEDIPNSETIENEKISVTVKLNMKNMTFSVIPFGYGGPLYEKK